MRILASLVLIVVLYLFSVLTWIVWTNPEIITALPWFMLPMIPIAGVCMIAVVFLLCKSTFTVDGF